MNHETSGYSGSIRLMLMIVLALAAVSVSYATTTGEAREVALKTKIVNATIYGGKVQITRRGEVEVGGGPCRFICEDLPEAFTARKKGR